MLNKIIATTIIIMISITSIYAESIVLNPAQNSALFLVSQGIIQDQKDNWELYRFNNTITRKETLKITIKLSGEELQEKCEGKFPDVSNDWGCKYIETALSKGFIAHNDTFRPNENITKTEVMKLILKAKNIEKVRNTDSWQEDYMETAYEYGIIEKKYYDFDTPAERAWIFIVATSTVQQEEKIKEKIEKARQIRNNIIL